MDHYPDVFTQQAIDAIINPENCKFPWNEVSFIKLSKMRSGLAVCQHYFDWVDYLEIALFKEEITLREALLLAACPTRHLSHLIATDIYLICGDYDKFELHSNLTAGPEDLKESSSVRTGCSFHLFSPLRDWWVCPLEKALFPGALRKGWVYGYAQTMLSLRTDSPLTLRKLHELTKMISRKDISLYSVLLTLATKTRSGNIDECIVSGCTALLKSSIPPDTISTYVSILCSSGCQKECCPSDRAIILRSLWEGILCAASRTESDARHRAQVSLSVFHTQLRATRRLAHELKLIIELFWQQIGSLNPSEASNIPAFQIFTPKFLHWTLARERWQAHEIHGFAPITNEGDLLLRNAINGLLNGSDPTSLIALVEDDVVTFDTALWLMIILNCEGKDAVFDVIRTCSVVPEIDIMSRASGRWKFCLLQSISYLRVDERQSLNMICRDVRSFIHTPLMEEKAMVETLNITPFGIYHLLCAHFSDVYQVFWDRAARTVESVEATVTSKRQKPQTWHQMGLYTYNMLALELRKFSATDQRIWFPGGSTVVLAWKAQGQPTRRLLEAYRVRNIEEIISNRGSYVARDDRFSLVPFSIKVYLSDPDIRCRAVNINDQEVTPFHVLTPYGQPHCEWHLAADDIEAMKACDVTQRAEKLLSLHMEVFDLEPNQWWHQKPRLPSANKVVGEHNQVAERVRSINDLQHKRLKTWYRNEGTSLCASSIKVFSDNGWTFLGYEGSTCTQMDVCEMRCIGHSPVSDYLRNVNSA